MNTKIRYDLDSLELANGDFGYPITEKEVRKVNRMLELMENVRSRHMCPTEGDCVEFVSRSGDYFGKAHIERITGKYADICLIPETVFCFDDMGKAAYDTTGSPWTQVNIRNMKPAGTKIRIFRTWGFGKRSSTGSLRFDAPVRKWEYREPNPLYDGYTTRNWFRYHIMKHRDRERTGEYTFRSDSFTLYSRSELDELAAILKGRLYKGILPDSLVLWGYRMDIKEISREQWNGMGHVTLVKCVLETGRTHQIRVHMASIGHPLLGDEVYSNRKSPFKLQGQTLHAKTLGFVHPRTGKEMFFTSELPEDMTRLLDKWRTYISNREE